MSVSFARPNPTSRPLAVPACPFVPAVRVCQAVRVNRGLPERLASLVRQVHRELPVG